MNKKEKILAGLGQWLRLNLLLLVCMIAVRPLFFLEVYFRVGLEPRQFFTVLSGALFDFLLVARIFTYGLIPFLLFYLFLGNSKVFRSPFSVFRFLIVLYAIIVALLAEYYCNMGAPLDHVVLVYTFQELKTTVFSSTSITLSQVLWFLLLVGVPVLLMLLIGKRRTENGERKVERKTFSVFRFPFSVLLLFSAFLPYNSMIREERLYADHQDFCLAVNQPSYAFLKINDYRREEHRNADGDNYPYSAEAVKAFQALHPAFEYDTPGYPLYRKANDSDVLGPYLERTSDGLPPNLVFIIVEGLGQRLTGVYKPALSFTPFIDSLAATGLYWPNCFSTSERTFGVLPAVFASAPHGRYGFTKNKPLPRHHSLLKDLDRNGYASSFYYGGDASFDNYDLFLKTNHVEDLMVPEMMVEDSAYYKLLTENNRWGLDDAQLFEQAFHHKRQTLTTHRPQVDVFLTLSTHEPFVVDDLEQYEQQVLSMLDHTPGITDKERDNVMKNLNVYACFLYLDQSLKSLMNDYASCPDYANTIFVITGDHRMAPVPFGLQLHYYNVPLIVYSPLVKQPKTMRAVVSHLDITPSFNAYLSANYDYTIDNHCHWLGTSFDTVSDFRNTRKLAFMRNNRDVLEYMSGDYTIDRRNNIIRLDPSFIGRVVDDRQLFEQCKAELDDFQMVSHFVVQHDVLMP